MSDFTLALEGSGISVDLNGVVATGRGVQVLERSSGFGLPPRVLKWQKGAASGGKLRSVRDDLRDVDLLLLVQGRTRPDMLSALSDLMTVLSGPLRLWVTTSEGRWFIDGAMSGGGDYTHASDVLDDRSMKFGVTITGDPYFSRAEPEIVRLRSAGGRGLLPNLAALRVSGSQVSGDVELENEGTVPSFLDFRIDGPASSFTATSPSGDVIAWSGALDAGECRVITGSTGVIVDGAGAWRYEELGDAPVFWLIPPGRSTVNIAVDGSTPETTVSVSWVPRVSLVV